VNSNAKKRSARSFIVLTLGMLLAISAWILAWGAPQRNGLAAPFRQVLEWNGSIWQSYFDPSRTSEHPAPPAGTKPRVNGDLGLSTEVDPESWEMEVRSDQEPTKQSLKLNMAAILALPKTSSSTLFHCIEGWSQPLSYAGVRFSDFMKVYGVGTRSGKPWNPENHESRADLYRYVGLATPDGEYYVSIDMESMLHSQTLLAYEMNGQPLEAGNGAPLRLLIPVKYGIKNLKRIGMIRFSDTRPPDYWEERGYDWFSGL
jgi:DMSO/TMAO reductase YedYZ molybdopterin-dependent catalytic subunit